MIGNIKEECGKRYRQIIVRFTTWHHRTEVYRARKNSDKYRIRLDLTKERLKVMGEHLGINKAGQKIKGSPSAIWDHINKSGHAASVEDFSVLDRANNDFDLLTHESLLILRDRPSLNSQQSSIPLALF